MVRVPAAGDQVDDADALRGDRSLGQQAEGAGDLVDQAEQILYDLSQQRVTGEWSEIEELLKESFERITQLYESGVDLTGTPSGFRDLDRLTSGFQPGNLIIVAARPSMGKSALALCMAANMGVRHNIPVGLFTLEMSKQEVTQRLICLEGKIDSHKIRTGKLAEEDWSRLSKACAALEQVPLFLDGTAKGKLYTGSFDGGSQLTGFAQRIGVNPALDEFADLAEVIHDLNPKRRAEVAAALDDERLADVLEELPEDDQVEIIGGLANERAADVLEAMEPDDAADLLADLPPDQAEQLLQLMEPDEAADLRRLLTYDENTAGGLMTTEPVILGPDASIAEALAVVRRKELSTALACTVFVCRPPLETPTGKFLGMVHIQRLLREPPHASIGTILDKDVEPVTTDATVGQVTRLLATYDLVGLPVVDDEGHLLGAVTVDDVLDHILPEDWREDRHDVVTPEGVSRG